MGYDENFLGGDPVPLPTLSPRLIPSAWNGGAAIHHTRFSIIFNSERGLAICTAHTIDGETLMPEAHIERDDRFRFDPDVDRDFQIDNDRGYRSNPWDRGHMVRRRSVHWGEEDEARQADSESYFWTNIAPQHEHLHDTAWGPIEDWMLVRADSERLRAAVFTGPVMTPDDPVHQNGPDEKPIQIPAGFWKVIVVPHRGVRTLAAFLVWQRDHDSVRPVTFAPFLEQVRLTTVEFLTGLSFNELRHLDPQRFGERTRAFGPPGTPRSGSLNAVNGPSDIAL